MREFNNNNNSTSLRGDCANGVEVLAAEKNPGKVDKNFDSGVKKKTKTRV